MRQPMSEHDLLATALSRLSSSEPLRFVPIRIDDEAYRVPIREERPLRPAVRPTKEDAKIGMTVVPTNNHLRSYRSLAGIRPDPSRHPNRHSRVIKLLARHCVANNRDQPFGPLEAVRQLPHLASKETANLS